MSMRPAHGISRSAIAAQPEAMERLWLALDRYVEHHPEELEAIGELSFLETEPSPPLAEAERRALWLVLRRRLRNLGEAADSDPRIKNTLAAIKDWISEFSPEPECNPHVDQIRGFVLALGTWIAALNAAAGLQVSQASILRQAVLQSSFPVLKLCLRGQLRLAARYLISEWLRVAASLEVELPGPEIFAIDLRTSFSANRHNVPIRSSERRLLWTFQSAVLQILREEEALREGLEGLIDLRTTLDLDAGQLGRLLHVPVDTVRRWEMGEEPIPQGITATLVEAQDSLQRLKSMFLPARLSQIIRRPAELFGGDSALEWILHGRIRQVTDRYDLLLRYQS